MDDYTTCISRLLTATLQMGSFEFPQQLSEELLRLTSATARQTFEHLKVTGAFVTHKLSHVARSRTSEHISRALRARLLWLGLHNFALLCSEQYASTKVFVPL